MFQTLRAVLTKFYGDTDRRAERFVWLAFLVAKHMCLSTAAQRQIMLLFGA